MGHRDIPGPCDPSADAGHEAFFSSSFSAGSAALHAISETDGLTGLHIRTFEVRAIHTECEVYTVEDSDVQNKFGSVSVREGSRRSVSCPWASAPPYPCCVQRRNSERVSRPGLWFLALRRQLLWLVASAFCFGEVGAFLHVDLWPLRLQMYITHREDRIRQVENVRTPSLSHCGSHAYYRAWVLSAKLPIQQRSCEQWTSAWTWLTSSSGCTRLTSHELRDLAASPTFHYTRHSRKCCSRRGCSGICR